MKLHLAAAILLSLCLIGSATATTQNLIAALNGPSANAGAGSGSSGTGSATMTFDDITGTLFWIIWWNGLSGPVTAAHFHGPATASQNAGIQVTIGGAVTSPAIASATISAPAAAALLNGLWYINIHTAAHPNGEIRGQVLVEGVVATEAMSWSRVKGLYD